MSVTIMIIVSWIVCELITIIVSWVAHKLITCVFKIVCWVVHKMCLCSTWPVPIPIPHSMCLIGSSLLNSLSVAQ